MFNPLAKVLSKEKVGEKVGCPHCGKSFVVDVEVSHDHQFFYKVDTKSVIKKLIGRKETNG